MSDDAGTADGLAELPVISAARARLDRAVVEFNRHAIVADRHRAAFERFRISRAAYEAGTAERTALRDAREAAARHRAAVRSAVGEFVRLMRDAGLPPETVLVAVKKRLTLSITAATPGAPEPDASQLESDASLWAIKAYFEAA